MIYSWLFAESDHCQSGIMTHRCHKLLTFWYQKLLGDFHITYYITKLISKIKKPPPVILGW
jgi:hypothetical protein